MTIKKTSQPAGRESVGEPFFYSVNNACRLLSISRSFLYLEIAAGRLKTTKLGARALIHADEMRRFVASLQAAA